jgi:hypothetical protein
MWGDPSWTLRDARAAYLAEQGLPADGGYAQRWVVARVGSLPFFAFPNSAGRRRIAPVHDLHHVATGYATSLAGEAEIAAWEIGTGCRDRTGLRLGLRALGFALPRCGLRCFRAFVRGRHSRNLLDVPCDDALLARSVADLRHQLGLDAATPAPTREDRWLFIGWAARAAAIVWGPLIPMAAAGWWLLS